MRSWEGVSASLGGWFGAKERGGERNGDNNRRGMYLEFVLEEVLFVGEFSVEAEELLLFLAEGLE